MIRARAPTYASGAQPSPWPAANGDVRYWSMRVGLATGTLPTVMNTLPSGGTDPGCRADDQTKLEAAGEYAYVQATEAQESNPTATAAAIGPHDPRATVCPSRTLVAAGVAGCIK